MPGPGGKDDPPKTTPWDDDSPTLPTGSPQPEAASAESSPLFDTDALAPLAQRYDVLNELGRGGMGAVYRARDRETGDIVALKILLPEIAGQPQLIERFKSELLLARKITHKNVCRTHELLRFGSTVVISMEYVEGESLRAFLRSYGAVPLRRGLEWVGQICSALAEAHAQGIVHRDLKPENILLTRDATSKVMDFGIARSLEGAATQTVGAMGTPAYMSPEQAEGRPADARSDIYSLGLMMYEMFAGRPAFHADTPVALVMKQVHETPPDPIKVEPLLPAFLDRAIRKCLEKNPKKRFQSVADLQAALTETSEPSAAAEVEAVEEVPVPVHLAHWRREEYYLLGAAILAFALFFFLYDGLFPWAGVEYQISAEQASQKALALVSKFDSSARISSVRLLFGEASWGFHRTLLMSGLSLANQGFRDGAEGWDVAFEVGEKPNGPNPPRTARVRLSPAGEFSSFGLGRMQVSAKSTPPTQEQVLPAAVQYMKDFYGQDVSKIPPTDSRRVPGGDQLSLRWELPGTRPEIKRTYVLMFVPEGLIAAWNFGEINRTKAWEEKWRAASQVEHRLMGAMLSSALGLVALAFLMVVLFFVRRLYQRTQPRALWIAFVASLVLGGTFLSVQESKFWESAWYTVPPGAVLSFLLVYAVASVAEHYLLRALASRVATWRMLFRERFAGQAAGLAVLRGVLFGVLFLGLYAAVLRSLALLGWIGPGVFWLGVVNEEFSFLFAPGVVILATLACALCFVAFPAALAARASRRPFVSVLVPTVLCLVTASTLPGASPFPLSPLLFMAALQGFFFAYVLYRYDFLTLLVALFTVETWVLVYPVYRMFHRIEWWKSSLGMLPWYLLLLLGLVIYFRPQLSAGVRRVAAVFE